MSHAQAPRAALQQCARRLQASRSTPATTTAATGPLLPLVRQYVDATACLADVRQLQAQGYRVQQALVVAWEPPRLLHWLTLGLLARLAPAPSLQVTYQPPTPADPT